MPDQLTIPGVPAASGQIITDELWNNAFGAIRDKWDARLGNLTDAQIPVANASGQIVGRTMSGAAAISNTGVLSLNTFTGSADIAAQLAVGTTEVVVAEVASVPPGIHVVTAGVTWIRATNASHIMRARLDSSGGTATRVPAAGGVNDRPAAAQSEVGPTGTSTQVANHVSAFFIVTATTTIQLLAQRISGDTGSEVSADSGLAVMGLKS